MSFVNQFLMNQTQIQPIIRFNGANSKTILRSLQNCPTIYLSDAVYAQTPTNLVNTNIGLIINASSDSPANQNIQQIYRNIGIDYLWVPIDDTDKHPSSDYLPKIVEYVRNRGYRPKNDILIHCTAGINRSALVAAAILWYTTPNRQKYWDNPKKMIDYMRTKQMIERKTYLLINNTFYIYLINNLK